MLRLVLDKLLTIKVFVFFSILILLLKIAYSFYSGFSGLHFEDWSIAENIVNNAQYAEFIKIGPTAYKLPVYPLFLSFFMYVFPGFYSESIVICQHLIFFIIPFLIIKILKIFNKEKAGIIAAYIFIFSPAYFYYSNVYESTNLFIPIFLVWIYTFLKIFKGHYKALNHYIFFGLITAILLLTQVVVAPLVGVLIMSLIVLRKATFKSILVVACSFVVLYSPWVIRNYTTFDKVILTKTPVWQNIYLSYTPNANIWNKVNLIPAKNEVVTFKMRSHVDEFKMEEIYKKQVQDALKGKKEVIFLKGIQNAIIIWTVPSRYFYDNSLGILLGRKLFLLVINSLTLISLVYYFKRNKLLAFSFLLLFVAFTMPYVVGHAANMRFKLDFEYFQYMLIGLFLVDYCKERIKIKNLKEKSKKLS